VLDIVRVKLEPAEMITTIAQTAMTDGPVTVQIIEEEKGSSGPILVEAIRGEVINAGIRVESSKLNGDRTSRAIPVAGRAGSGRLALLNRGWTDPFIAELDEFPLGADDQVDALSASFNHLSEYEDRTTVLGSAWFPSTGVRI
jgi:predicted phage terminase large subunit-like protein